MTWLRPPRESSLFTTADSFLGYLQLLFLGLLVVACAGMIAAGLSFSGSSAGGPGQVGVVRRHGVDRILLRRYRVFPESRRSTSTMRG